MRVLGSIGLVAALGVGCEDVGSGDVLTSGMWADISFTADGSGTSQAAAVLRVGGPLSNTYVELEGDDELTATLEGTPVPMSEEHLGDIHRYVAGFVTAPVGETVTVAFERTVDGGAPRSEAELPPELDLAPLAVTTFSRGSEELRIEWSPTSAELMRIEVSGDCIWTFADDIVQDDGSYTLAPDTLEPLDAEAPVSCSVDVVVTRLLPGLVDPAYGEGGTSFGRQVRDTEVGSSP
jgi:hypothetical protein